MIQPQLSLASAQKPTGKSLLAATVDCAAEVISAAGPHETSVRATPGLRWRFWQPQGSTPGGRDGVRQ